MKQDERYQKLAEVGRLEGSEYCGVGGDSMSIVFFVVFSAIAGGTLGFATHASNTVFAAAAICSLIAICFGGDVIKKTRPWAVAHNHRLDEAIRDKRIIEVHKLIEDAFKHSVAEHLPEDTDYQQLIRNDPQFIWEMTEWATMPGTVPNWPHLPPAGVPELIQGHVENRILTLKPAYDALKAPAEPVPDTTEQQERIRLELQVVRALHEEMKQNG